MMRSRAQVVEDDQIIKRHVRRASSELESALVLARRGARENPRARNVELDLARLVRALEDIGTLSSKYPVEQPIVKSSLERQKEQQKASRERRALRLQQQQVSELVDGQDLVEESDE